jgi:hypothetical protein
MASTKKFRADLEVSPKQFSFLIQNASVYGFDQRHVHQMLAQEPYL